MNQSELRAKTGVKRGKKCNRYQARESMQLIPSAGKRATGAKRGKTCNRCQALENMQLVPSAGKHATGAKRGNIHATGAKREKTVHTFALNGCCMLHDFFAKSLQHVYFIFVSIFTSQKINSNGSHE